MEGTNGAARLLWERLNAKREGMGITWRRIAADTGVNASTLSRLGYGHAPGLENASKLFAWLRDERQAECTHDWRYAYAYPTPSRMQETYYCTKCLRRQVLLQGEAA